MHRRQISAEQSVLQLQTKWAGDGQSSRFPIVPSLFLSHPPKSFCFFPSPWLLSPFHDSLLSSLAFFELSAHIYCFQTSLRFLHLFIGPVLTLFRSFFLTAIFLFSHRHSFILLMKVLLWAKGIVHPKLKMYLLNLYVIPNS